jgi:hypothetical protein
MEDSGLSHEELYDILMEGTCYPFYLGELFEAQLKEGIARCKAGKQLTNEYVEDKP